MATYWENSCSFGLRYVSWYKYLIVSLVFSHLGFWSGNLFLIAPFPDLCLLVPFHMEHPWEGGKKVDINGQGHMIKMAAMVINRNKTFKIFFSRTRRPMILKLGMKHQVMELYKVDINHDPGMTLTFFTARST